MNKTVAGLVFGMTLTLSLPVGAHTDGYFESIKTPHGGQLRAVGPFLVAKDGDVTLYVTDHADNAISVDGGLAKANIENGSSRIQVNLHPVGSNILRGAGIFSLTPSTVVVIFIKLPNHDSYAARFNITTASHLRHITSDSAQQEVTRTTTTMGMNNKGEGNGTGKCREDLASGDPIV